MATNITPVLRYRDPRTAARWLCEAFGFSEHETVQGAGGEVTYVLLRLGANFVLVLPVADLGLDGLLVQPQAVGGGNTQVCYVTVPDADAHRARAASAGAQIEIEPQDDGLGGQFYTCRDFEGHLWSFGTRAYGVADAEAGQRGAEGLDLAPGDATVRSGRRSAARVLARSMAVAAAMTLTAAGGWMAHRAYTAADAASAAKEDGVMQQLAQERQRLAAAESTAKDAEERLAEQLATAGDVRRALQQAQSELLQTRSDLTLERQRKGESAAALASLKGAAADLERGKARAEAELAAGRERIAQEKALAKAAAERATVLQAQVDKLRQDRAAEREDLSKAKAALLSAQAQLKAVREAKAEASAQPASQLPAAVAVPARGGEAAGRPSPRSASGRRDRGGGQHQGARLARAAGSKGCSAQSSLPRGGRGQVEDARPLGGASVPRRGDFAGAGQVRRGVDAGQGKLGRRLGVDRATCADPVLGHPQRPPDHRLLLGEGCSRGAVADGDPGLQGQLTGCNRRLEQGG